MKCLLLHNRRTTGPKESSWWTFHYISKELKKRGHLLAEYSVDYNFTDDNGNVIPDKIWDQTDCIFTVFRAADGPLQIAKVKHIPSFLEINYACSEIVTPFMEKEVDRFNFDKAELCYESPKLGKELYESATYLIGAGNEEYTEKTYKNFGLKNVKMFDAGIDCDLFKPDFSSRGNGKIRFTFTAAYLAFRKGITYLSRAWRNLPSEYHDRIELHIFGKKSVTHDTENEFDLLMSSCKNVIYHGFISNHSPEYIKEHSISDIMLCPTLAEGQSATALEGVAFGLYPVVSPYTGVDFQKMPSIVLSPEPKHWINELERSIVQCVDNYENIKKARGIIRKYAEDNYQWNNSSKLVVDFMEEIYRKHITDHE